MCQILYLSHRHIRDPLDVRTGSRGTYLESDKEWRNEFTDGCKLAKLANIYRVVINGIPLDIIYISVVKNKLYYSQLTFISTELWNSLVKCKHPQRSIWYSNEKVSSNLFCLFHNLNMS